MKQENIRTCGNCRWWKFVYTHVSANVDIGACNWPIGSIRVPNSIIIEREGMYKTESNCPTWEDK